MLRENRILSLLAAVIALTKSPSTMASWEPYRVLVLPGASQPTSITARRALNPRNAFYSQKNKMEVRS